MAKRKPKIEWHQDQVVKQAETTLEKNMENAMQYLSGEVKKVISRRNSPRVRVGRSGMRGLNPSEEGTPPKVMTGTLRSNVSYSVIKRGHKIIGVVGVRKGPADKYARRLEEGFTGRDKAGRFVNQGARPFLRSTLREKHREVFKRMTK